MPHATTPSGPRVAYDDEGHVEPTLLLLPGWCDQRSLYDRLAPRLAPSRVIRMDWRGHGDSAPSAEDYGTSQLVEDALAVVARTGTKSIVPVAQAHAGWVALELARRLGPRVRGLVFLSWTLTTLPPPLAGGLQAMSIPASTRAVVEGLTGHWSTGVNDQSVLAHIRSMRLHPDADWARAAREILAMYTAQGSPLDALTKLSHALPCLHVRALADPAAPAGPAGLREVVVPAASHFPALERPEETAAQIRAYLSRIGA